MSLALDIRQLGHRLGDRQLLEDINLSVTPGSVTGLIGPNGAGKSTLMKLLAGILPLQSGSVSLDGRPLADWQPRALARARAWLPQQSPVHWPLSVLTVAGLGRLAWHRGSFQENDRQVVAAALADCGIAGLAEREMSSLSQGEQALAHMARVLGSEPRLMLLDEPVAALDPGHQLRLLELVQQRSRHHGSTSLVILHDLALAARYCDHLVLLHQGRIVAHGSPQEVLSPANLLHCYGVHAEISQGHHGLLAEFELGADTR